MPHLFEEVRRLAMKRSCEERGKLSEQLWWSFHLPAEDLPQEEIDAAWDAEIKRRIEDINSGAVKTVSLEEALSDMEARLKAKRQEIAPKE